MSFESTDKQTANGLIQNAPCRLIGAFVGTDGTNDATLTIYDNLAASGKIIRAITVPGSQRYGGFCYEEGINMHTAIYCTISGTGAFYFIDWKNY